MNFTFSDTENSSWSCYSFTCCACEAIRSVPKGHLSGFIRFLFDTQVYKSFVILRLILILQPYMIYISLPYH